MRLTDEQYDNLYADIRALMAEHFSNFMFVVMDDEGDIYYDYTNLPVGKMLAREMMEDAGTEEIDVDWDYEFEETEDEGDEWKDE
jgi:hypothetical protein